MSGTGDLLEHRPDGSDAYDTLYIGCEKFPQHDVFAFDAGEKIHSTSLLFRTNTCQYCGDFLLLHSLTINEGYECLTQNQSI